MTECMIANVSIYLKLLFLLEVGESWYQSHDRKREAIHFLSSIKTYKSLIEVQEQRSERWDGNLSVSDW